ncbi:MAG TPA: CPBP family intramembrane glutamic endopeptidase, partial [Haliangiales bacterium]|nr:CPBP family intramembrane glutamic endopeptidase [Haliangiales bacterium]
VVGPLAGLYVGLVRHAPREATATALRLHRPSRRELGAIAATVLMAVALAPVTQTLDGLLLGALLPEGPSPEALAEVERMKGLILAGSVLAQPVGEELLFRGFLLPRLAATAGRGTALLLISGVYALSQLQLVPVQAASALVLGLAFGVAALASETAWAAIAGHVAHQAARLTDYPTAALPVGATIAAAALVWLARRRPS